MAQDTGCSVLTNFDYATENLGTTAHRIAARDSIWMNLIPRAPMKMNVGTHFVTYGVANQEFTSDNADGALWHAVDLSNVETSYYNADALTVNDSVTEVCSNDWNDIYWGLVQSTYYPEMTQLEGPIVCEKDLLFSHMPDTFLEGYNWQMAKLTKRTWDNCYAFHYRRLSAKVICMADMSASIHQQAGFTSLDAATSELTQDMLDYLATELNNNGACQPDEQTFISYGNSGPLYSLYIDQYQSNRLCKSNSELRNDIRYADPNMLLARIGATKTLGNFKHIINQMPARYTHDGSDYTPVAQWVEADNVAGAPITAHVGNHYVQNPSWKTAPYEGADILCTKVFTSEVPNAPASYPAGINFAGANDYSGTWKFVRGAYRWVAAASCNDPLEQQGRHYAQFMHAPALNPVGIYQWGFHIIYKRCLFNKFTVTTCSS